MIGETISHYKIIEKLGEGGMGEVYAAGDTKLGRTVALKFLPLALTRDPEARERFIHEARAISALDHNNICTIHEIDETDDGRTFIVMARYEGETLKERMDRSPLGVDDAVDIAVQIARGLAKAHEKGITHRDIKPSNVFVTADGVVKIIDFGLAKLAGQTRLTKEGTTVGTVAYMSPEQSRGDEVDRRSDIWSLGVILYEMLAGALPFKGDYEQAVIYSIMNEEPPTVRDVNPGVPPELQSVIDRALKKNPESRYSSATEIIRDLIHYQEGLRAAEMGGAGLRTFLRRIRGPKIAIPAIGIIIALVLIGVWFFDRRADMRWAREEALPGIERLIEAAWWDYTDAYQLAVEAERYIPGDPRLAALLSRCSLRIDIETEPAGARVYMKEFNAPDSDWEYIGVSPLEDVRLPIGIFRWKIEKEGFETVLAVETTWDVHIWKQNPIAPHDIARKLDERGSIPAGMVRVAGGQSPPAGELGDFFIDRCEVTNAEYKAFINSGGYQEERYWKHPFIKDGTSLTWDEAMAAFVDRTGRTGPASWLAGDYPDGRGEYPVSGISWYEAAAYAEWVGKRLPTAYHWDLARGEATPLIQWPQIAGFGVLHQFCNFDEDAGPVPAGSLPGMTAYGAYDMAGNVREWCWNETPDGRVTRGGAWNDVPYMFGNVSQAPPFDRSLKNGFRCALYPDPEEIPPSAFEVVEFGEPRDYRAEEPVSDEIFAVYCEQFSYDETPLDARVEERDESADDWIHERITFDAAYGDERIIAHLCLPKRVEPPYQTVIYFPGGGSTFRKSSEDLKHYWEFSAFLSCIVKSGRAALYPVYKGTFERSDEDLALLHLGDDSHRYTEYLTQLVKDFRRCVDYLESRPDIDEKKLAYCGMSWGGRLGAIIPAVEERLRASVLIAAGFYPYASVRPEADPFNYITRVETPTLILNGRYDTVFPCEATVKPFFDLMGTPDEHKELKLYETDHLPPKNEFIKEMLAWFDRYLGPVG
jgi:cephalosporin-C deacetylase-like acetyl esterase